MTAKRGKGRRRRGTGTSNSMTAHATVERSSGTDVSITTKTFQLPSNCTFIVMSVSLTCSSSNNQPGLIQPELYSSNGYVVKTFAPFMVPSHGIVRRTFRWPRGSAHVYGKANESDSLIKIRTPHVPTTSKLLILIAMRVSLGTPEISLLGLTPASDTDTDDDNPASDPVIV